MRRLALILIALLVVATPAEARHRPRVSHVRACAAVMGTPCQAEFHRMVQKRLALALIRRER